MKREFPKTYESKNAEKKWYNKWLENKVFAADAKSTKKKYSILMPPPNVTGILHFGHVLNNAIQDIYIRYKRMSDYEVCWFPGIDHAGIATQTKVEHQLKDEGLTRHDIGREKFLERVWDWKHKYGGIIFKQLEWLGISCDWDRTIFTMDDDASNAVKEVFIRLFDEGLIYRGKRIINWSPLAQTALSDEEVEFREVREHFYTLRYYFPDRVNYLKVATVRPETIFGDVAVAVNPEDERYKHLIGQQVYIPLVDRLIPIIADEHADPTFGTGCVKITPAHDPNDFEVGLRHNLDMPNTINPDGTLNELTGEFNKVERFEARKRILVRLKELDLVEKIEDYSHNVGFSQRGGEPVEPYLSNQWFVSMKPLAEEALKVVQDGKVKFHPEHWVKTYEHWMNNVRDWCISRQLWWGHRIPVYYAPDGRTVAATNDDEAHLKLGLDKSVALIQDPDVLDTWFSSWLWPMTTMHWLRDGKAETTDDLEAFLPTDLLVTAPDIIFFWVARMIAASMKFKNEIPFRDVYFTSLIRDGQGRKLSKSLGNSPDPLNIIEKYGADAVRFTMVFLSPLGQDVRMDVDVQAQDIPAMEMGRNFVNKVWNAGRFLLMKQEEALEKAETSNDNNDLLKEKMLDESKLTFADRWIVSRFNSTIKSINANLDTFKLNEYSKLVYDFVWRDFCDWYIEVLKVQMNEAANDEYKQILLNFAVNMYENILKMLHPIIPFITEEIYHLIKDISEDQSISKEQYPQFREDLISLELEEEFLLLQQMIEEIRSLRANIKIPPHQKMPVKISTINEKYCQFLETQKSVITILCKCSDLQIGNNLEKPENSLSSVIREVSIYLTLDDTIDFSKERERHVKEIERLERNISGSEKKLSNEGFVAKAPADVIAYEREKLESMKASLEKVKENLLSLK